MKNLKILSSKKWNWAHSDFQHFRFFCSRFSQRQSIRTSRFFSKCSFVKTVLMPIFKEVHTLIREEMPQLTEKYGIHNIAVLILDNETRSPLVWIGSESFWDESINGQVDMLRSKRQPGSTIKPFLYASAILMGYEPPTICTIQPYNLEGNEKIFRMQTEHFRRYSHDGCARKVA